MGKGLGTRGPGPCPGVFCPWVLLPGTLQSRHSPGKLSSCGHREPTCPLHARLPVSFCAPDGDGGESQEMSIRQQMWVPLSFGLCQFFPPESTRSKRRDHFLQSNQRVNVTFSQEITLPSRCQTSMGMETPGELTGSVLNQMSDVTWTRPLPPSCISTSNCSPDSSRDSVRESLVTGGVWGGETLRGGGSSHPEPGPGLPCTMVSFLPKGRLKATVLRFLDEHQPAASGRLGPLQRPAVPSTEHGFVPVNCRSHRGGRHIQLLAGCPPQTQGKRALLQSQRNTITSLSIFKQPLPLQISANKHSLSLFTR